MKLAISTILLTLVMLAGYAAQPDLGTPVWRWHEKQPLNRTTRYFRIPFTLEAKAKSAPFTIGMDDIGRIYVNGTLIKANITMGPKTFRIEKYLRPGKNVIAINVLNHINPAGIIFFGEVLQTNGKIVRLSSRNTVRSNATEQPNWIKPEFDDSKWKEAETLGGPDDLKPWNKKGNMMDVFRNAIDLSLIQPQWRWHEKQPLNRTTRYFRIPFTLEAKAKSAPFTIGMDDIGRIYVNGTLIKANITMGPKTFRIEKYLRPGKNVIAINVLNHINPAGIIFLGEILQTNGKIVRLNSRDTVRSSATEQPNWKNPDFDDSKWKEAEKLGGPDDFKPWNKKGNMMDVFRLGKAPAAKLPGRVLLDDFADISSWLGWGEGKVPGTMAPFHFSLGSVPDPRRDDGWAGALCFAFAKPGGKAVFNKNRLYQMRQIPSAVLFSADTEGHGGSIRFSFFDKFNRPHLTIPVKLSEKAGWKDYKLELNNQTLPGYSGFAFPLSLNSINYICSKPGTGRILIDDLFYMGDVSEPGQQLEIHPDYNGLAAAPGTQASMTFRFRNGLNQATRAKLTLRVFDSTNKELFSKTGSIELKPYGFGRHKFDLGKFSQKGVYSVRLFADTGKSKQTVLAWLGIFQPNNKRLNQQPMWFGIEDQEVNTAPYEATLHASWMKLLGVDLIRAGFHGSKAEEVRGGKIGYEGFRKMWEPHVATGAYMLLDFAGGMPAWTWPDAATPKNAIRPLGSDPARFREHFERLADFIASMPSIRYFEWINEPNLSSFYRTDQYCEAMRLLYPILKAKNPKLKIGTGGLVVNHPAVRIDFTNKVCIDNAKYYDILFYHAHSGYNQYIPDTNAAFKLLNAGKKKVLANTEAGFRSYQGMPHLFYNQARELVKKITYSKSKNLEFYIWFMLQDYWDKYRNADDSFGLVTVENQPKPAFVAYNELIRQLANALPAAAPAFDPNLEDYLFRTEKEDIRVLWPKQDDTSHTLCLESKAEVRVYDIFGNEQVFRPVNGIISFSTPVLPFYLRSAKGSLKPVGSLLAFSKAPVRLPGTKSNISAELRNPFHETVAYIFTDNNGKQYSGTMKARQTIPISLSCNLPANAKPGPVMQKANLVIKRNNGTKIFSETFRFPVSAALPVSTGKATEIVLDNEKQLMELAFDPSTPRWAGKADLSAKIRIRRDAANLIFEADVSDNNHSIPRKDAAIWMNDSIQIGITDEKGNLTEFTVSAQQNGAPVAWRHIAVNPKTTGLFLIPLKVTRDGNITRYRFSVPFSELKISPAKGTQFRLAFLVNDNDSGRRLRTMEFFKGIEGNKNPELFGWCILN